MNLTGFAALIKRIQVLATSAISWLSLILVVLVAAANQLEGVTDAPSWLVKAVGSAVAFVTIIIAQVRRVTPVQDADKGLLPPKGPAVPAGEHAAANANVPPYDEGAVNVGTLLMALAFVCFVVFTCIAAEWVTSDKGFVWLGGGLALWVAASFAGPSTP